MSSSDHNGPNRPKGRRKVPMQKIENESNRQVSFSKRKDGVLKKANELCSRTGAEASVVVFSPGGKPHSFGHPDVNTVADRFLDPNRDLEPMNPIRDPNLQYMAQIESQIEVEKKRKKKLNKEMKALEKEKWVPSAANIEVLNYKQLKNLKEVIEDFSNQLETHVGFGAPTVTGQVELAKTEVSTNDPNVNQ